jgi:hypothetical protein
MTHRTSREAVAGIHAKLASLRRRKAFLDDLIGSVEHSAPVELTSSQVDEKTKEISPPWAGAA